jgi:hypothetical protein
VIIWKGSVIQVQLSALLSKDRRTILQFWKNVYDCDWGLIDISVAAENLPFTVTVTIVTFKETDSHDYTRNMYKTLQKCLKFDDAKGVIRSRTDNTIVTKKYKGSMTWLTGTEYMCHKWPRICSVCRNPVLPLFIAYVAWYVTRVTRRKTLQKCLKFDDAKGVIRSRTDNTIVTKKYKGTKNNLQNTTQKTNDRSKAPSWSWS